MLGNKDKDPNK